MKNHLYKYLNFPNARGREKKNHWEMRNEENCKFHSQKKNIVMVACVKSFKSMMMGWLTNFHMSFCSIWRWDSIEVSDYSEASCSLSWMFVSILRDEVEQTFNLLRATRENFSVKIKDGNISLNVIATCSGFVLQRWIRKQEEKNFLLNRNLFLTQAPSQKN